MMIGGAVVNVLAFSGSNYLFSRMGKSGDAEKEGERHDKALEQLEEAQAAWSKKKRTERLDFINEEIQKEHHAAKTFDYVDQAMKQYFYLTGKHLPEEVEPKLSDLYTSSPDQQNREITFIV